MYSAVKAHGMAHAIMETIIDALPYDHQYAASVSDIVVEFHNKMALAHDFGDDFPVEETEFTRLALELTTAIPETPDTQNFLSFVSLVGMFSIIDAAAAAERGEDETAFLAAEAEEWLRENSDPHSNEF